MVHCWRDGPANEPGTLNWKNGVTAARRWIVVEGTPMNNVLGTRHSDDVMRIVRGVGAQRRAPIGFTKRPL